MEGRKTKDGRKSWGYNVRVQMLRKEEIDLLRAQAMELGGWMG